MTLIKWMDRDIHTDYAQNDAKNYNNYCKLQVSVLNFGTCICNWSKYRKMENIEWCKRFQLKIITYIWHTVCCITPTLSCHVSSLILVFQFKNLCQVISPLPSLDDSCDKPIAKALFDFEDEQEQDLLSFKQVSLCIGIFIQKNCINFSTS